MFDRSFDINVKGPYFLMQALLPIFANPASVVLNTSVSAHAGAARSSVYAATKAAFLNMSKTLSTELLGRGIRVNAVSPGPIDRKSTRLNSSHQIISYAVFCLKK